MSAELIREWILKGIRSGLLEPARGVELINSGAHLNTRLGRLVRVPAPLSGSHSRSVGRRLDISGSRASTWDDALRAARERDGAYPQTVVIRGIDDADRAMPLVVFDALRRLITQSLENSRGEQLRLICAVDNDSALAEGLAAMFASANSEENLLAATVVSGNWTEDILTAAACMQGPVDAHWTVDAMQIFGDRLEMRRLDTAPLEGIVRTGGTYVIAGGLGALGFALSRHLSRTYQARLVLIGTRPKADVETRMEALRKLGGDPEYMVVDLSREDATGRLLEALEGHSEVRGVVQCAGVTSDALLRQAPAESVAQVINTKVRGVAALDAATAGCQLDFFAAFSSISGLLGNFGQSDYAFANAYQMGWMRERAARVAAGDRHGRSVAIAWPFWEDGGISAPRQAVNRLTRDLGIEPLQTWLGMGLFETALTSDEPVFAPVTGSDLRIPTGIPAEAPKQPVSRQEAADVRSRFVSHLVQVYATVYEVPADEIRPEVNLQSYGLDSVLVSKVAARLVRIIPNLPTSVFFDCSTIDEIADRLLDKFPEQLADQFGSMASIPAEQPVTEPAHDVTSEVPAGSPLCTNVMASDMDLVTAPVDDRGSGKCHRTVHQNRRGIAIVGYAAQMAGADNAEEIWQTLAEGLDRVSTFPASRRTDLVGNNSVPLQFEQVAEVDWHQPGSFIDDPWGFDARFFGVSAREARCMDPQERVALEKTWQAFEDAGITPEAAAESTDGDVGVFAAMTNFTHYLLGAHGIASDSYIPQSSGWSLANRISSAFDFHGPSQCVDTGCSSSLYALVQACQALTQGDCRMAVVTAANLYLHPLKFAMLRERNMLSDKGRCFTFGANADGFVPAEGAASLILRPVEDAERDGDDIKAVVWSWAVNHGGSTHGYTVPSPKLQASVIRKALEAGDLSADQVSLIEAHGTGTPLGDPIEIEGLTDVFSDVARETPLFVSSIKSNFGHAESMAGLASVIKIMKQMEHRQMAGSLHSQDVNPRIQLAGTGLEIVQSLTSWTAEPKFAGTSSFGAGGSNAHVILREPFPRLLAADDPEEFEDRHLWPFLLSAADEKALGQVVDQFISWVRDNDHDLRTIALELDACRTALDERLCVFAADRQGLVSALESMRSGVVGDTVLRGSVRDINPVDASTVGRGIPAADLRRGLDWIRGVDVDWRLGELPRHSRLNLPLYPFQHKQYHVTLSAQPPQSGDQVVTRTIQRINFLRDIPRGAYGHNADGSEVLVQERPHDGVTVLRMNNVAQSNLLDSPLYLALSEAFHRINQDDTVKVVVLTGTDRVFCMGGVQQYLDEIVSGDVTCSEARMIYLGLPSVRVPVIAAVSGHAHGGGLTLGLSADIPVLAEESLYAAPFMNLNLTPGAGSTYFFAKRFGQELANEMFYTGRDYTGAEIKQLCPSMRVMPKAAVMDEAMRIARGISKKSLKALFLLKRTQSDKVFEELPDHIAREAAMQQELFSAEQIEVARDKIAKAFRIPDRLVEENGLHAACGAATVPAPTAAEDRLPGQTVSLRPLTAAGGPVRMSTQGASGVRLAELRVAKAVADESQQPRTVEVRHIESNQEAMGRILAQILREDLRALDLRRSVTDLGLDSVGAIEFIQQVNQRFHSSFDTTVIYQYPRAMDLLEGIAAAVAADDISLEHVDVELNRDGVQSISPSRSGASAKLQEDGIRNHVLEALRVVLRLDADEALDLRKNFQELGLDSVSGIEFVSAVNTKLGTAMQAADLYGYGSVWEFITDITVAVPAGDALTAQRDDEIGAVLAALTDNRLSIEGAISAMEQK
ncbi:This enzymatic domain is part of bacterial polyketide synthases and catalyses the first step in the reductive modification of the beta-carbonyl centres in the growing polyketide chain. It uses NADPH to reduce the keto group to a hydroxy group [Propionibacterium ruminifibrarum]|uniref:Uncharacterized protein n=1 Tax=Propionibacterium ruminifibrarum TaxID=1962131 RepID=A0A375I5K7_9ACTN|nr:polyketide synthase [Propionibacterium ruminifibrarum]SPF68545.1 This enzymatic domain is part of bacterial polyketide synthases and catalyses the first step in the reductive modification of the beta-carbonyl centres in the growing polyketide chain. It uses NADPH to reduce the keto group to a hydroxy group [Propionibacterium ruminifibrarum]